jgi:hypothetical protein
MSLTGRCMCEGVRYEVSEPLVGLLYCHCTRCQRRTGVGYSASGQTRPGTFALTEGDDLIETFVPGGGGWNKSFCSRCGTHLFTVSPEDPDQLSVRVGTLVEVPSDLPAAHQFAAYAPAWAPVPDDGLPRFQERITR